MTKRSPIGSKAANRVTRSSDLKPVHEQTDPWAMAEAITLGNGWASDLALATSPTAAADNAGLHRLPAEWETIDRVVLDDFEIDHVVVGPNGVFTISIDADPLPADLRDDGIYRNELRVTTIVKSAVKAAHDLRRRVGYQLFAYPMLATTISSPASRLDRLGVVPGEQIAEAIWNHPGRPLTRSQRTETSWALHSLAG
jgi:hypothetical protein